jgi:hypothetical protein
MCAIPNAARLPQQVISKFYARTFSEKGLPFNSSSCEKHAARRHTHRANAPII